MPRPVPTTMRPCLTIMVSHSCVHLWMKEPWQKVISEKTKLDVEKNGRCRSWQSSNEFHRIPRKNLPVPSLGCRWRARAAPLAKARHSGPKHKEALHAVQYALHICTYITVYIDSIFHHHDHPHPDPGYHHHHHDHHPHPYPHHTLMMLICESTRDNDR